jgi:hypothetical protein
MSPGLSPWRGPSPAKPHPVGLAVGHYAHPS